jgi:hypothetical protein
METPMPAPTLPTPLWYQSFVHPTQQAPYIDRLQRHLDSVAGPGHAHEVHGLDPPDHLFHPLTEFRADDPHRACGRTGGI